MGFSYLDILAGLDGWFQGCNGCKRPISRLGGGQLETGGEDNSFEDVCCQEQQRKATLAKGGYRVEIEEQVSKFLEMLPIPNPAFPAPEPLSFL